MVIFCWGHGLYVDGGSHSWHVYPSASVFWSFDICLGRHCECIRRRRRSHCMRLKSPEFTYPRSEFKHGGKVPPEFWIGLWRIGAIYGCRLCECHFAGVFVLCEKGI